jgi:capsular polysaccharide biosynthesis protein
MDDLRQADSLELADYLRVLRRRWWIIVGLTCLGIALSAAYVIVAPKVYSATAAVEVTGPANQGAQQTAGAAKTAVNMDNETQLVQSAGVATIAAKKLDSPLTPTELSKQITVTVPANSQLLQITCSASSAAGSAACANAFAAAFLQNSASLALGQIKSQLAVLNSQATSLLSQITKLNTKISNLPPNDPTRAGDAALASEDTAKLHSYANQIASLEGQEGTSAESYVATSATPPNSPSSPKKALILPSGAVAGLVLGLMLAFVADRRDKRIRSASDVERLLDLPVLLSLPQRKVRPPLALVSPRSRTGQAISEVAQVVSTSLGDGNHVVLVAGTSSGPSTSMIAVNLASALARMHVDAILVCGDMRGTVAPQLLGLGEGRGLAELLIGTATVSEVARRPADLPRLRVITPGVDSAVTLYDLQHDVLKHLAGELRAAAHYVIIEARSSGEFADTFALAQFADAALIVVDVPRTIKSDAVACVQRLDRLRTPALGALVLPELARRPAAQVRPGRWERSAAKDQPARQRSEVPPPGVPGPQIPPVPPRKAPGRQPPASQRPRDAGETWPLPRMKPAADQEKADTPKARTGPPEGHQKSADTVTGS